MWIYNLFRYILSRSYTIIVATLLLHLLMLTTEVAFDDDFSRVLALEYGICYSRLLRGSLYELPLEGSTNHY